MKISNKEAIEERSKVINPSVECKKAFQIEDKLFRNYDDNRLYCEACYKQ